ncbi:MAG: ATP-dependent helicase, partial [Candidatus Nanopelagicales bacterium]
MNPVSLRRNLSHVANWTLNRDLQKQIDYSLDDSQMKVVQHNRGALIVLAGPGTGKTATLTQSVIARLKEGISAEEILVITFARDAAAEVRNRIISRIDGGQIPTISTFHSLALSIVREFTNEEAIPKLVSAPEQEAMIRELVSGFAEEELLKNTISWPEDLSEALTTRGLSVEIRNALARVQTLGLRSEDIERIANEENNEVWKVVGPFLRMYLDTLADMNSLDYNELMIHANELVELEFVRTQMQERFKVIYVDEYQDSDPLQIKLLKALTTKDTCLVVVGDPDQSIYSFRGAETQSVENFAETFGHILPRPSIHFLSTSYRFGEAIRDAAHRVISRNPIHPHLQNATGYRQLQVNLEKQSSIDVTHYRDDEHQATEIVEKIMQLRASHNFEWQDFAILVRSGIRSIPTLQRTLISAGVPVTTTFDEIPLIEEPPVHALLLALKCAAGQLTTHEVIELLHTGLADMSPSDTRRLARLLKQHHPELAKGAFWSESILSDALMQPAFTAPLNPELGGISLVKFQRLQKILLDARTQVNQAKSADEILWDIWTQSKWPERLRKMSLSNDASASIAHHHLDSVISFFESLATYRRRIQAKLTWRNTEKHIQSLYVPTRQV